jgi:hypothetical protein
MLYLPFNKRFYICEGSYKGNITLAMEPRSVFAAKVTGIGDTPDTRFR